jgi:hypothetical protein
MLTDATMRNEWRAAREKPYRQGSREEYRRTREKSSSSYKAFKQDYRLPETAIASLRL